MSHWWQNILLRLYVLTPLVFQNHRIAFTLTKLRVALSIMILAMIQATGACARGLVSRDGSAVITMISEIST
ncbi:hypothetical protein BJV82DRAFT_608860 [Fennellomyces sp. T-0311]|nr:hypothetical protein BJV82DRAFT_608860 [Fennellomyces sp. T-0311]